MTTDRERLRELLERWRLNVALECSGASLSAIERIAIGGAVLELSGLHEVLEGLSTALDEAEEMRRALEKIERWFGEFPETGKTWESGNPMSYGACYGSNGERDFMREIARKTLGQPK